MDEQLLLEAGFVGVALLPLFTVTDSILKFYQPKVKDSVRTAMAVALAGALFHLLAEESGLNTWYLSHSHASQKKVDAEVIQDAPCDGSCGYERLGVSHALLH